MNTDLCLKSCFIWNLLYKILPSLGNHIEVVCCYYLLNFTIHFFIFPYWFLCFHVLWVAVEEILFMYFSPPNPPPNQDHCFFWWWFSLVFIIRKIYKIPLFRLMPNNEMRSIVLVCFVSFPLATQSRIHLSFEFRFHVWLFAK